MKEGIDLGSLIQHCVKAAIRWRRLNINSLNVQMHRDCGVAGAIAGDSIRSFIDLIRCGPNLEVEIFKSTIIKALIQINRNHGTPGRVIAQECAYFMRIEAAMNPSKANNLLTLATKLGDIT